MTSYFVINSPFVAVTRQGNQKKLKNTNHYDDISLNVIAKEAHLDCRLVCLGKAKAQAVSA